LNLAIQSSEPVRQPLLCYTVRCASLNGSTSWFTRSSSLESLRCSFWGESSSSFASSDFVWREDILSWSRFWDVSFLRILRQVSSLCRSLSCCSSFFLVSYFSYSLCQWR